MLVPEAPIIQSQQLSSLLCCLRLAVLLTPNNSLIVSRTQNCLVHPAVAQLALRWFTLTVLILLLPLLQGCSRASWVTKQQALWRAWGRESPQSSQVGQQQQQQQVIAATAAGSNSSSSSSK
jgi:hypothetical protein